MIGHHAVRGLRTLALAVAVTAGPLAAAHAADLKIKLILNWKY